MTRRTAASKKTTTTRRGRGSPAGPPPEPARPVAALLVPAPSPASHRIASHRIASHCSLSVHASHCIASHRIASHRIASHRIVNVPRPDSFRSWALPLRRSRKRANPATRTSYSVIDAVVVNTSRQPVSSSGQPFHFFNLFFVKKIPSLLFGDATTVRVGFRFREERYTLIPVPCIYR